MENGRGWGEEGSRVYDIQGACTESERHLMSSRSTSHNGLCHIYIVGRTGDSNIYGIN